jgi:hypothetical protein
MTQTKKWNRMLAEQKRKEQSHILTIPEYERLKLSVADEKRYREEYLGEVMKRYREEYLGEVICK